MDVPNTPRTRIPEPYDPAGSPPLRWNAAQEVMDAVRRELEQLKRDGKGSLDGVRLPRSYTIREAAEKTGRPRHEIYRLIRQRQMEARMNMDGPALWLIPEEEVEKLMPEDLGRYGYAGTGGGPERHTELCYQQ